MENEIKHIKNDVTKLRVSTESNFQEIKGLIENHIKCNENKYEKLKDHFAGKWVERIIIGMIAAAGTALVIASMSLI